jgi:selenoprotein W-related protein
MTEVEIEYCVPCGFLPAAEQVQHALLSKFGRRLDCVDLVPGNHGVFQVRIDGETVYDRQQEEFDVDAITRQVRSQLRARLPTGQAR